MGYTWFAVDDSVADHPKVMALESALQDTNALAYVLRLWCWTHRYAPTGFIPAQILPQLERAMRWSGAATELISALRKVGLLDASDGGVSVHDWPEHQGALVKKSRRDAELKRKQRRQNGAKTARAGRSNGAQTAPAPTYLQDLPTNRPTDEKPAPASRAPANPGWQPTIARLVASYAATRGAPYAFTGRDAKALKELLRAARDVDELDARWRLALERTHRDKYQSPKVHTLTHLALHWNAFPVALEAS